MSVSGLKPSLPYTLFSNTSWRQRTYKWSHYWQILLTSRQALAYQVIRSNSKVTLLQRYIGAEAIEERQLEIRRLAQCSVRTHLYTVTAEDTAIQREGIAFQGTLGHHQRSSWADLHAGTARDAVRIV